MSRLKKSRKAKGFIPNEGPSRREKLADPDSYESRRRKAVADKKKPKSVYEKSRDKDNAGQSEQQEVRKTRLQDKIRKLNEEKNQDS